MTCLFACRSCRCSRTNPRLTVWLHEENARARDHIGMVTFSECCQLSFNRGESRRSRKARDVYAKEAQETLSGQVKRLSRLLAWDYIRAVRFCCAQHFDRPLRTSRNKRGKLLAFRQPRHDRRGRGGSLRVAYELREACGR